MKRLIIIICLIVPSLCAMSCRDVSMPFPSDGQRLCSLEVSAGDLALTRSGSVTDENRIRDLNIWIYDGTDGGLKSQIFKDGLAIAGSGNVSFYSNVLPGDVVLLIANAGRAEDAPAALGMKKNLPYPPEGVLLFMGSTGALDFNGEAYSSDVSLSRVMARLTVPVQCMTGSRLVEMSVSEAAGMIDFEAGNNIAESARCSVSGEEGCLISLSPQSGERFYLLPDYSAAMPAYLKYVVHFGAGLFGEGDELRRLRLLGAFPSGFKGGGSYECRIAVSDDPVSGSERLWERDVLRFASAELFVPVGESQSAMLAQRKPAAGAAGYTLSLDPVTMVEDDGRFRISRIYDTDAALSGASVQALAPGASRLYVRDGDSHCGWIDLKASHHTGLVLSDPVDTGSDTNTYY